MSAFDACCTSLAVAAALMLGGCVSTNSNPQPRPIVSETALQPVQSPPRAQAAEPLQPVGTLQPRAAPDSNAKPEISCEMYRKITRVMTPAEQAAVMQAQTTGMSPQRRAQFLERIRNCR